MARILIVDDAAFMRMMLKNILTEAGHEVVGEAANGADAVDQYNILHPDIVTMDITMPTMDGLQALHAINEQHPSAKILMCTAMGQQEMVINAIKSGARDFIVKPFDAVRIREAVAKLEQGVRT